MAKFLSVISIVLTLSFSWASRCDGKILYYADYEEGEIFDGRNYGIRAEKCCEHSINCVEAVARRGRKSCRFESRREDPEVANCPGRAELKVQKTKPIVEEWYAWSIYVPKEMQPDVSEILGQWHAVPDFKEGETWRSPPMAVRLEQDKWHISGHYAEKRVSTNRNRKQAFSRTLEPIHKDVWTDWVFHIKWDYRTPANGGAGLVRAWQQVDGKGYKKIIDYTGPVGYNDELGVYLKWGIYKYPWKRTRGKQSPRYYYYDEVKIGDVKSTFEEMKIPEP